MTSPVEIGADDAPRDFHLRWPTLKPPLRPAAVVVEQIHGLIGSTNGPVLLLGVTPELAAIDRDIIAVDWSAAMIALAWPGDGDRRQAVAGDWKALPLEGGSMGAAMGDGAFTMLDWPDEAAILLAELWRVLLPGGRAVVRCFATAEVPDTLEYMPNWMVKYAMSFHEFRLRFNMAAARADGAVAITSARLFEHYQTIMRDAAAVDWPAGGLAEIEAYAGSAYIHCYPKRSEMAALLHTAWPGSWQFVETSGYPGAELCPLLVLDR